MPGPKTLGESVPEPEYSSPVLTWILGYFWSLLKGVGPPLELGGGIGAPLDMGGTLVLPWSGDGCSGNFLSCSKGVKDTLEVPEVRCD